MTFQTFGESTEQKLSDQPKETKNKERPQKLVSPDTDGMAYYVILEGHVSKIVKLKKLFGGEKQQ